MLSTALAQSAGSIILGNRHQRDAAQGLEDERRQRSGAENARLTRRIVFGWVSLLVIAGSVLGLGFTPTHSSG